MQTLKNFIKNRKLVLAIIIMIWALLLLFGYHLGWNKSWVPPQAKNQDNKQ